MLFRELREGESEDKRPGFGRCIYCLTPMPESKLTEEHVIPKGLGGTLVLLNGSCTTCQRNIHRIETHVIRRYFGITRELTGINSGRRRGKKHPRTTEFHTFNGEVGPNRSPWVAGTFGLMRHPMIGP
jgi:hypothetical protein